MTTPIDGKTQEQQAADVAAQNQHYEKFEKLGIGRQRLLAPYTPRPAFFDPSGQGHDILFCTEDYQAAKAAEKAAVEPVSLFDYPTASFDDLRRA